MQHVPPEIFSDSSLFSELICENAAKVAMSLIVQVAGGGGSAPPPGSKGGGGGGGQQGGGGAPQEQEQGGQAEVPGTAGQVGNNENMELL